MPTFVHKRADDNQYIITKRHLDILLLELKANNVAEHHLKFVNRVVHKFLDKTTQHGDYWSFTVEDLISHLQELQKQYSPSMYRKHITYLKKLFRIANLPLEHHLKSPRYVGVDMTVITVQDVQALLKIIRRVQFAKREEVSKRIANKMTLGLLIMATSGLRVYELTKLPLSYIDLDKRLIRVPPSVAKTGQPRVTFITKEVQGLLKKYIERYNPEPDKPVISYFSLEKPFIRRAELINQPIRPKHMRKFFSQEWDRRNGNATVKKLLMGHSIRGDINVLHYSHHTPESLQSVYDEVFKKLKFGAKLV
ncbi:Integrase [Thermococcus nautili]|uniref:Integrase n=1 Tax=Thermococcus nautili TaxID=195522 RepID=W8NUH9_9EURY|nr:site-specific integrase [Thermococcus nautili]AHL22787.1 Integrase [Thermococcus nautili]CAI1492860.1 Integrase [Thermococcus nautili]